MSTNHAKPASDDSAIATTLQEQHRWFRRFFGTPSTYRHVVLGIENTLERAPLLEAVARRVAKLNPNAGEIGAGMLRTIVSEARRALGLAPLEEVPAPKVENLRLDILGAARAAMTTADKHETADFLASVRQALLQDDVCVNIETMQHECRWDGVRVDVNLAVRFPTRVKPEQRHLEVPNG